MAEYSDSEPETSSDDDEKPQEGPNNPFQASQSTQQTEFEPHFGSSQQEEEKQEPPSKSSKSPKESKTTGFKQSVIKPVLEERKASKSPVPK